MGTKNILGMDLLEWNILSGLSDPYSLELAKISAEAGVPNAGQIMEAANPQRDWSDPESRVAKKDPKKHRLALIKRSARKMRQGANPDILAKYARTAELKKQKTESGEQAVFPYDVYLEAFLEDNGSSMYEFNMLMDYAIEHADEGLMDELLAVEEVLDEVLGGALAGAAKAVGGALKTGAKVAGSGIKAGAKMGGQVLKKGAQVAAKGAGQLAGQAKAGFQQGMQAAGNAAKASAGAAPAPAAAPAPTPEAPAPQAPAAQAPAAPQMQGDKPPPGAQQPGQTAAAAKPKQKKVGALGQLARGIGKVAKGVASMPGGLAATAGRVAGQVKKGYAGEDIEMFEEFLAENDLTPDQYMAVVEQAFEYGDVEMIESMQQLDEIFAAWKAKKAAAAAEKAAATKAAWARARAGKEVAGSQQRTQRGLDLTPAQKAEMEKKLRAGGAKYQQAPAPQRIKKSVNEAIRKQLSLAGYTDEYIESLSEDSQGEE